MAKKPGYPTKFPRFTELPNELKYKIWMECLPPRVVYLHKYYLWSAKCYRVWSNCANDEEGNKSFFSDDPFPSADEPIYPDDLLLLGYDLYHKRRNEWAVKTKQKNQLCTGFRTVESVNPVASVCHESHDIFSKHYTRAFGSAFAFPETRIDFKRDTLYLDIFQRAPDSDILDMLYVQDFFRRNTGGLKPGPQASYEPKELSEDAEKVQSLAINIFRNLHRALLHKSWIHHLSNLFGNAKKIILVECPNVCGGYRGPWEVEFAFDEKHAERLRNVCWQTYQGGYRPASHQDMMEEYESEVARIAEEFQESFQDTDADSHRLNTFMKTYTEEQRSNPLGSSSVLDVFSQLPYAKTRGLPNVEVKEVVFRYVMEAFERDKKEYYRLKDAFKTRINLHCRGLRKATLRLQLPETTTMKEMVSLARAAWNIPEDRVCEGVYDEHHVKIPLASKTIEQVDKSRSESFGKSLMSISDIKTAYLQESAAVQFLEFVDTDILVYSVVWKDEQELELRFQRRGRQ